MIPQLPFYIPVLFALTSFAALFFSYYYITSAGVQATSRKANLIFVIHIIWLIIQGILAISGFYSRHLDALPPKLLIFGIIPPLLLIAGMFLSPKGRLFMDGLPLRELTLFNVLRIPVEIGLFLLYLHKAAPKLMTFEGGNLDILSGITALFLVYFVFKKPLNYKLILIWNLICLGLLLNIVARALLSAPFPLQKLAFEQPNIAILYFPFTWLPTFIVPLVLFGHLVSIRKMIKLLL